LHRANALGDEKLLSFPGFPPPEAAREGQKTHVFCAGIERRKCSRSLGGLGGQSEYVLPLGVGNSSAWWKGKQGDDLVWPPRPWRPWGCPPARFRSSRRCRSGLSSRSR